MNHSNVINKSART